MVSVFSAEGAALETVALPAVFSAPIRPDVVNFVHTNMSKNARQAYAVTMQAGRMSSAASWGTGRAVSRIPRTQGGGTQASGQGAYGNMCRGGHMFAPTQTWRKWHRKVNLTQKRYAVCSALAASACPPLVMARGHKIESVPEMPLVVGGDVESEVTKTKGALALLAALGADADATRCADSKKLRAGKGKMRNRRFVHRKGPLVVYSEKDASLARACRNLPGVDTANVERLNLLTLAPGGHVGRFVVWTASAFATLDKLYGAEAGLVSEMKKGYVTPRPMMENADLARIINSDEIQSVVKPVKTDTQRARTAKRNPLKNLDAMLALNPYHATHRASEMRKQAASASARAKVTEQKRAGTYKVPADVKKARAEKNKRKAASTEFYNNAKKDGEVA